MRNQGYPGVMLGVLLLSASTAWAAPVDGEKIKDWTVRCETLGAEEGKKLDVKVEGAEASATEAKDGEAAAGGDKAESAKPAEGGTTVCQITQILTEKESNNPVMQMAIGFIPEQKHPVAVITLPMGIWLPPGVQMQVDGGKKGRVPVDTCVPGGCRAGVELDDEFLATMKKGNVLNITFGGGNRQPITVPVSLNGFTAALDKLKEQ